MPPTKTVRFTNVIAKSGKPEIYMLLSKDDETFKKALKADRILSILGGTRGSPSEYGVVGYDGKQRGQLLLFPRSLGAFKGSRIVGMKYELFSEHQDPEPKDRPKKPAQALPKNPAKKQAPVLPKRRPDLKTVPPKASPIGSPAKSEVKKVINFPAPEPPDEEKTVSELRSYARQALRALEKNNAVAAYNLVRRIAGEEK